MILGKSGISSSFNKDLLSSSIRQVLSREENNGHKHHGKSACVGLPLATQWLGAALPLQGTQAQARWHVFRRGGAVLPGEGSFWMERWEKASPSRWHLNWKEHPRSGHLCEQKRGSVGSTLGKGSVGLARHMGSRAAGERRRWQGTLLGLDGGRLGQAERPELHGG